MVDFPKPCAASFSPFISLLLFHPLILSLLVSLPSLPLCVIIKSITLIKTHAVIMLAQWLLLINTMFNSKHRQWAGLNGRQKNTFEV